MILVSACLAGIACRYDGESKPDQYVCRLVAEGKALPVCPEQLGGLSTPRIPSEIRGDQVVNQQGEDVSDHYRKGAKEALGLAKMCGCQKAILKDNSPMCGVTKIYDGTFTGKLVKGEGILTTLLKKDGITIESRN